MKKIAIALVPLVFLAACGSEGVSKDDAPLAPVVDTYKIQRGGGSEDILVIEFALNDGTRCVVSEGYNSGGVDCDW